MADEELMELLRQVDRKRVRCPPALSRTLQALNVYGLLKESPPRAIKRTLMLVLSLTRRSSCTPAIGGASSGALK